MLFRTYILCIFISVCYACTPVGAQTKISTTLDYYGDAIELQFNQASFTEFSGTLSPQSIQAFCNSLNAVDFTPVVNELLQYKLTHQLDDWLYYQLIRKTANFICPKAQNYNGYTLYKWLLLTKSGYNALLTTSGSKLLFYVQSNERIYDIPYRLKNNKQYVCLNFHDFESINFDTELFTEVALPVTETNAAFTYKVTRLPDFKPNTYIEKNLQFTYQQNTYEFRVKLNPYVNTIFANYPSLDYASYFKTPLSVTAYQSLIPSLKKAVKGLSKKNGIDYLMRFTRYAFLYKPDTETFGKDKRLLPELTLLYNESDCEDRAALFFYLVKEIYDVPMLVLVYPKHVTIAVHIDKPVGNSIVYDGRQYTVCEPTPLNQDLKVGQLNPDLKKATYEIAYAYNPGQD